MKKFATISVILIVIAILGIAYWKFNQQKNAPEWRTFPARKTIITQTITSIGTINPITQVDIGTEVSGKIEKLYKDFNDTVSKGELLAKLDTETLEMAFEEAKIELTKNNLQVENNKDDLDNKQELFEHNMISDYELKQARFTYDLSVQNLAKAKFALQRAQKNLNNAFIYSPIDGIVTSRNVDEGQTVAASLNAPTLFIIANKLEEMQIEATIDEADIGKVLEGLEVRFTVDAYSGKRFKGAISQVRLNPSSDQNVITYPVIISIQNPENILLPGMTANLEIIISEHPDVLAIQERATQFKPSKEIWEAMGLDYELISATSPNRQQSSERRGQRRRASSETNIPSVRESQIWILDKGMPKQVTIQVGESDGTFIEVLSGIKENDQVIVGVNYNKATNNSSSAFSTGMPPRRF